MTTFGCPVCGARWDRQGDVREPHGNPGHDCPLGAPRGGIKIDTDEPPRPPQRTA